MGASLSIVPVRGVAQDMLRAGMVAGFQGYAVPMAPNALGFARMMRQRGLDREASFVVLEGETVRAIWIVSVAGTRGYLIASGTDPAFRGQGLARRLAGQAFEALRARGVTQFETEVIAGNDVAERLYRRLGMRRVRRYACYNLPDLGEREALHDIVAADWSQVMGEAHACRDWAPSWQNNDAALARIAQDVYCVASYDAARLAGYAAVIGSSGTLAQLAVRPDLRRKGRGASLLQAARGGLKDRDLQLTNADEDDAGFAAFVTAMGGTLTVRQHGLSVWL